MGMLHIEGTTAFREKLSILVSKYIHVFSTTVNTEPARIAPFKIELDVEKWDSLPHERYARPQSHEKQEAMKAFLQKALRDKIIQKSSARQFSQVLLARKKNGKWRFCVDFRRLNLLTKALGWPLQNIESLLIRIGRRRGKLYATLDLTSGFHQTALSQDSRRFTAFITEMGVYEWARAPMGPKGVPSYFTEQMETVVFKNIIGDIAEIYVDDLITWAQTDDELISNLERVFKQLDTYNVTINPEKCKLGLSKVEYVGHTIDSEGLHFSREKLQTVEDFRLPETQQQLRSFLGIASYFRSHIAHHATLSQPLHKMLPQQSEYKPRQAIVWTKEQITSSHDLRRRLWNAPNYIF
jgi:hypothetical protein